MASQQGGGGARPKTPRQSPETRQQAPAPTKEGWLIVHETYWKGRVKRHRGRYCVLEGQSRLVIFKDDTKTKVKAAHPLQQAMDVRATVPSSYVFEIRMAGDVPPLVLASRDKADMLAWIYTLNAAMISINGLSRHVNSPSQGNWEPLELMWRIDAGAGELRTFLLNCTEDVGKEINPNVFAKDVPDSELKTKLKTKGLEFSQL